MVASYVSFPTYTKSHLLSHPFGNVNAMNALEIGAPSDFTFIVTLLLDHSPTYTDGFSMVIDSKVTPATEASPLVSLIVKSAALKSALV